MEFIDLHTGFVLLGFDTHQELMRAAMLCKLKGKSICFSGEPGRLKEIKARSWVRADTYTGFLDYNYPLEAHYKMPGSGSGPNRKRGRRKLLKSMATAYPGAGEEGGDEVKYIIVCRK